MNYSVWMNSIFLCLIIVAAVTHVFGLFLLFKTPKSNTEATNIQVFLLKNLSIVEICITSLLLGIVVASISGSVHLKTYATLYHWTTFTLLYYLNLIMITMDRFLAVYLNIRYPLVVTRCKVIIGISVSWISSFIFGISYHAYNKHLNPEVMLAKVVTHMTTYFFPTSDLLFLSITSFSYGYIYRSLRHHRMAAISLQKSINENTTRQETILRKIRANVFVPVFLITSFFLCIILPGQALFFSNLLKQNIPVTAWFATELVYVICVIIDALTYIMFFPQVKKTWMRMYKTLKTKVF